MSPEAHELSEQLRYLKQIRKHVSADLANHVREYFKSGKTVDDLKDLVIRAGEERVS